MVILYSVVLGFCATCQVWPSFVGNCCPAGRLSFSNHLYQGSVSRHTNGGLSDQQVPFRVQFFCRPCSLPQRLQFVHYITNLIYWIGWNVFVNSCSKMAQVGSQQCGSFVPRLHATGQLLSQWGRKGICNSFVLNICPFRPVYSNTAWRKLLYFQLPSKTGGAFSCISLVGGMNAGAGTAGGAGGCGGSGPAGGAGGCPKGGWGPGPPGGLWIPTIPGCAACAIVHSVLSTVRKTSPS